MKNTNSKALKDEELVRLSLENSDNFLHLMQRYETRLLAYIHRLINAPTEDAEDILQEVFIKTYENLNDFDTSLRFSSWIYRITHNHTISFYRKFKNQPSTLSTGESQTFFENLRDDTDIPNQINQKLNSKKIATLLQKLDKKYHTVLILRYLEGKDYSEISDILKKPMGTVATLLNRAKSHFKKILITNGHDG